ncbi:hypothetical protein GCM10010430_40320 [Kitasatospora cystarginea]|uniref:Uncharacterized protein n=1 Tax=Kitasatospora cystarginea TaxID=58350 RepID=A0ABN3EAH6_9ACTN
MAENGRWVPPLTAGRRAAGLALLGWLEDPRAPRLCRVSGPSGAGKSHLLAWLVAGCTTSGTPGGQRIHAVLPAAGATVRSAVWTLGQQLGVVAHGVRPLLEVLAADDRHTVICVPELDSAAEPGRLVTELLDPVMESAHVRLVVEAATGGEAAGAFATVAESAVLELDDPRWTDRARFDAWCAEAGADAGAYPLPGPALGLARPPAPAGAKELIARVPRDADGALDLRAADPDLLSDVWTAAARAGDLGPLTADPLLYALARPTAVTAATEGSTDEVALAWDAAGPAVIDEGDPGTRAAVLRTRLLGVDAAAASTLAPLSGAWAGRWARWRRTEGWPGPAVAMAPGAAQYVSQLLVADAGGSVRGYDAATGRRSGSVVVPDPRPLRALAVTAGGTVVLLDPWGGTELVVPTEPRPGVEPHALTAAVDQISSIADELTALAAIGLLPKAAPAFGDAAGEVHWYQDGEVVSERLHHGAVTALAATAVGGQGLAEPEIPLLASGGLDGAVRLWGPYSDPLAEPCDRRDCPVTAVAVGSTAAGPLVGAAWADGLVRVRGLGPGGEVRDLRLGSEIWSMALIGTLLALGMPDGVAAIDLRARAGGPGTGSR